MNIKWIYKNKIVTFESVDIKPHSFGTLSIPIDNWEIDEPIYIECFDTNNRIIDKYALRQKQIQLADTSIQNNSNINVIDNSETLVVNLDSGTKIFFNKHTGLMQNVQREKNSFNFSGPFVNLRTKGDEIHYANNKINEYGKNWKLNEFTYNSKKQSVTVFVKGDYDDLKDVEYNMTIWSDGKIDIYYNLYNLPDEYIREAGMKFIIDQSIDTFSWKRNSYWSYYPQNHLSSQSGKISLFSKTANHYRQQPEKGWNEDTKSFFYNGTENEQVNRELSHIARSTKENIREFSLFKENSEWIKVAGNGEIGCRIAQKDNDIILHINHKWDYINLGWGNYQKNIKLENEFQNIVRLKVN